MLDHRLIAFVRKSLRSIWALEVLLLLRRRASEAVEIDAIVQELRATRSLVQRMVEQLISEGLVSRHGNHIRYAPSTADLEQLCDMLEAASRERPVALSHAIISAPLEKLRDFSNAFRFKVNNEDKGE